MIARENNNLASGLPRLNAQGLVELQHIESARSFVDHVARANKDSASGSPADLFGPFGAARDNARGVKGPREMYKIAVSVAHSEQIGSGVDLHDYGILCPVANDRGAAGEHGDEREEDGEWSQEIQRLAACSYRMVTNR